MGIIEDIEAMDLADEVKQPLLESARAELRERRRVERRTAVEDEIKSLTAQFSDKDGNIDSRAVGLLKFTRRVFLSDDEEPGLVLLSDDDLNLSDEERSGARQKEEITTAGALRKFIELLPRNDQGRLSLSDLVPEGNDDDRPEDGNPADASEKSRKAGENLGKITGRTVTRTRSRYSGGRTPVGGGS